MCAYVINNNGSSNNLPCYPPVINFRMLTIGGQYSTSVSRHVREIQ